MSFRELSMIENSRSASPLVGRQAVRAVARETGVNRKTVDRYVALASELGVTVGEHPSDEAVAAVGQRVQGRPLPAASDQRREATRNVDLATRWPHQGGEWQARSLHDADRSQACGETILRA